MRKINSPTKCSRLAISIFILIFSSQLSAQEKPRLDIIPMLDVFDGGREIDLAMNYCMGNFTIGLTYYWYGEAPDARYSHGHQWEANLGYTIPRATPLSPKILQS